MDPLLAGILLLLLLGAIVLLRILLPARELLTELHRVASGNYRPVILSGSPRYFRQAASNLRLISETLAKQKELLEEEEFSLAMILERMTEGVVITGGDKRIKLMNAAARGMFNLSGKTTGRLLQEIFLSHELQGMIQHASESGEMQKGELSTSIPGRSERSHLLITAAPLKTPDSTHQEGLLLVLHDITRLRELEAVRREFVANVSHEFRTPLSIINGYLETLEDPKISKEMIKKSVSVMRRHGDRLNHLIEDLLTISRMEETSVRLEAEPAEIAPLLRSVVDHMESEISARQTSVTLKIQKGLPSVKIDAYRIDQAFNNLLANALRHGKSTDGEVVISAFLQGSDVVVSFKDNGPGIPLQHQAHLFERFYRVGGDRARQTGGTGLGLSIVKNVVQAHGGRIALESKPGAGSTFSIHLPAETTQ
jgi:two-component system phosphate regulon sensor histidine kinase PhoR